MFGFRPKNSLEVYNENRGRHVTSFRRRSRKKNKGAASTSQRGTDPRKPLNVRVARKPQERGRSPAELVLLKG